MPHTPAYNKGVDTPGVFSSFIGTKRFSIPYLYDGVGFHIQVANDKW